MEAPRIPSLFKFGRTSGPKRFHFPTRYYDERKERLEERYEQLKLEMSKDELTREQIRDRMKAAIQDKWKRNNYHRGNVFRQARVLLIFVILTLIAYYIFYKDFETLFNQ